MKDVILASDNTNITYTSDFVLVSRVIIPEMLLKLSARKLSGNLKAFVQINI